MARIVTWFGSLSRREQYLVGAAAMLLAVLIGVYGIVMPVMDGVNDARRTHVEAVEREGRILAKIDHLDGPTVERETGVTGSLDDLVRQEASELGLAADDVRASGNDSVTFSFARVTAPALFGWLASLERRGLIVAEIDARPAAGSALSARIGLRRPQ